MNVRLLRRREGSEEEASVPKVYLTWAKLAVVATVE